MRLAKSALESRFGLRILLLFTASAIVPMLILAALAYTSTRDQLEEDALVSLRRDVKSAAMSIAEQIDIGAAQLELAAASADRPNGRTLNAFFRIDQIDPSDSGLTPLQREHLQSGRSLLLTSGAPESGVRLMRAIGDQIWVGLFNEAFLYKPERLSGGERYWVADQSGHYLFGVSSDEFTRDLASSVVSVETRVPFELDSPSGVEIAGAHHECVDGTGYPQGLGTAELSMQSRILGLADVFEALTSRTRPYKPGKSLTETLQILKDMVEEGKLDRDLHEVFVRDKVYLKYAAEFVASDQIDEAHHVDLESLTASWKE